MSGLNLTQAEASKRAAQISNLEYQVNLDLSLSGKLFHSNTKITFRSNAKETFVDLICEKLNFVKLNGQELSLDIYQDSRLELSNLEAENTLEVDCLMPYMNTGEGLHRVEDPQDASTYLYTQFEVPDARRVFATFEQPDLKAYFSFTIKAPSHWKVFSNSITPAPKVEGNYSTYSFAKTPKIPTYITAIVAGDFVGHTTTHKLRDGRVIELGAYCRKPMLDYLEEAELFEVTRAGFDFYEEKFGLGYPFAKYDQVFVPEFNAGAMENAALVTFREEYLRLGGFTWADYLNRTTTVLHEMAHMWFGDLVTMKWWDDLWLNESFAEYMSYLATATCTRYKDAWVAFNTRKDWGLRQDQKSTTHPVVAKIKDLNDVEVNFDGITYAKGAAVLGQLVEYVGQDRFFQGLGSYLTEFSYSNATFSDLLGHLEKVSNLDLKAWAKPWLREAGVTVLTPKIEADVNGRILKATVEQGLGNATESLRQHRVKIAGYSNTKDTLAPNLGSSNSQESRETTAKTNASVGKTNSEPTFTRVFSLDKTISGAVTEVTELVGKPRPDILYINDEDLTYAKVNLDPQSLETTLGCLHQIEDVTARKTIASSLWELLQGAKLNPLRFLKVLENLIRVETSPISLRGFLNQLQEVLSLYLALEQRIEAKTRVSELIFRQYLTSNSTSDRKKILFDHWVSLAEGKEQLEHLESLFYALANAFDKGAKAPVELAELRLGQDSLWQMAYTLKKNGKLKAQELGRLQQIDPSLQGVQFAARIEAATVETLGKTYQSITTDRSLPNDTRWQMAAGFWAWAFSKPYLYQEFARAFFEELNSIWDNFTFHISYRIISLMNPKRLVGSIAEVDLVELASNWLSNNPDQPDSFRRLIQEHLDDYEKIMKIRQQVSSLE